MPTKKPTTKKTVAKKAPVKKVAVKPAQTMEHKCECGCGENCPCHCHGRAHFVKHIIVWAIIFALGMVCGKMICCGHGMHKHMHQMHPVFVNECLDMSSIECPKMAEKLAAADVNGDGCISLEEYKSVKKDIKPAHKGMRGPKSAK